jgi:hypothetical protein
VSIKGNFGVNNPNLLKFSRLELRQERYTGLEKPEVENIQIKWPRLKIILLEHKSNPQPKWYFQISDLSLNLQCKIFITNYP